jgi:acetate kinase
MKNKNILIFNCGSSSLSYKVFCASSSTDAKTLVHGKAHRVGVTGSESSFIEHFYGSDVTKQTISIKDHASAAGLVIDYLEKKNIQIDCIGHRFVHGGSYFKDSVVINDKIMEKLKECVPLAPLHNYIALKVIMECVAKYKEAVQCVVFDSSFHANIPEQAYTYALPKRIIEKFGFRKFGFHGISYSYVTNKTLEFMAPYNKNPKIVACHLGTGGSSVCAIRDGGSIDTSMGYSPLSGLVMSTRSGDIDPMFTIYLMAVCGHKPDAVSDMLNKESGLLGISGFTSDIRDIIEKLSHEKEKAELAFDMYIHRIKKYIGSYVAALNGIDALVFTDDVGIHSPLVREKVCANMEWCGIFIDTNTNKSISVNNITCLNTEGADCKILSIPTDEEAVICQKTLEAAYEN